MKKLFFVATLITLLFCSCSNKENNKLYKLTYTVYYPNNAKTYTVIIDDTVYTGSDRGTNYLKVGSATGPTIVSTSAPIEVINCVEK